MIRDDVAPDRRSDCSTGCRRLQSEVLYWVVDGILHYVQHDYAAAVSSLAHVRLRFKELGGSNAQVDILMQTWISALCHCGRKEEAKQHLEEYLELYQPLRSKSTHYQYMTLCAQ